MILSGLAVLAVIVLIIVVASFGRKQSETVMAHAGSAEYDGYAQNIVIGTIDKRSGVRLNYNYARMLCTVQNTGDGVLVGLQLRAVITNTEGQVIKEKIFNPVPNTRDTLGPNQSMNIDVSIERTPELSEFNHIMTIELSGLKLK